MSEQETNGTGAANTRGGKYCPRCGAMAARDQLVCAVCGHQFRSGTASAGVPRIAPTRAPEDLHRTQQFTLPPLPRTPPAAEMPPPLLPSPEPAAAAASRFLWIGLPVLAALLLLGFFFWKRAAPPAPTPAGAWTTTLRGTGAGAQSAELKFVFADGGGGTYALGAKPPAPLHWTQTGNTLALTLTPPAPLEARYTEAQYSTLVTVFNGRPWIWTKDPARHTLTLGTLTFTETP